MGKKKKKMQLSLELSQSQLKQTDRTQLYHPPEGKSLPALTQCLYLLLGCVILSLYLTAALLIIFLYVYGFVCGQFSMIFGVEVGITESLDSM